MKKIIKVFLIIICTLVIAFFANGYFNGSVEYGFEIEIDAPKDFCWAEYQFPSNLRHWINGFKSIEMLDGGISEVGSKYKISFELSGSKEFFIQEIRNISPTEILECEIQNNKMLGQMTVEFSDDSKTLLSYKAQMEGKNLFWKSVLALCGDALKELEYQNYLQLKELVESSWLEKENSAATQVMNIYTHKQVY